MKGYFVCKPSSLDEVKEVIPGRIRRKEPATEIVPITDIKLSLGEYVRFCNDMAQHWEFLKPYADQSLFLGDGTARCVYVCAPGQRRIAVCLEGYDYPRYVAWPF